MLRKKITILLKSLYFYLCEYLYNKNANSVFYSGKVKKTATTEGWALQINLKQINTSTGHLQANGAAWLIW
jgi:hypothetical protein